MIHTYNSVECQGPGRLRYFPKYLVALIFFFAIFKVQASSIIPDRMMNKMVSNPRLYDRLVYTLIKRGHYFSAIPFAKEFLASRPSSRRMKRFSVVLEKLIGQVGIRQFETLPDSILAGSNTPVIRYIRAKKLFRKGRYSRALGVLKGVSTDHSIGRFILMLKGSLYALMGGQGRAIMAFDECLYSSGGYSTGSAFREKQYQIIRDYCLVGKARSLFALKKYREATLTYLDLDKSSFVWPEILFEEAWSSFFEKDYNRTLGKLVTYKAPVFQNFFIPEIDILRALSYMELCLWGDAKKTIDQFHQRYLGPSRQLGNFLKRKGRDYQYFYRASLDRKKSSVSGGKFYNKLLRSVIFEPGYQELYHTLKQGFIELRKMRRFRDTRTNSIIVEGVKDTLKIQKRLLGSYVRKQLIIKYALLRKSFTQMSYIKLEILGRNKSELYYKTGDKRRKRGDIKYLKRNEKQYFWSFNGEFWADELGDYVFALPLECAQ